MPARATALVTGASSGIGAAYARKLASEGFDVVLQGRREPLLAELCAELRDRHGVAARYVLAELSGTAGLAMVEQEVRALNDLEILINNAGFGSHKVFRDENIDEVEAMIRVHVIASVRLAHAALPVMRQRRAGGIVNVSSVAAFLISPKSHTYCATKAYLNSFSESLAMEVRKDGIRVQALCPGYTRTDFHARLGIEKPKGYGMKFMSAEEVVNASWRALQKGKVVCIPKLRYKFAAAFPRFLPRRLLYRLVERFA